MKGINVRLRFKNYIHFFVLTIEPFQNYLLHFLKVYLILMFLLDYHLIFHSVFVLQLRIKNEMCFKKQILTEVYEEVRWESHSQLHEVVVSKRYMKDSTQPWIRIWTTRNQQYSEHLELHHSSRLVQVQCQLNLIPNNLHSSHNTFDLIPQLSYTCE